MGTMLDKKLIQPFVIGPVKQNALRKPVLVIIITDGEPVGKQLRQFVAQLHFLEAVPCLY